MAVVEEESANASPAVESNGTTQQKTTEKKPSVNFIKEDPGLSYLKRPYQLGLEKEKELLEEARKRRDFLLRNAADEAEWMNRVTYGGVKVTAKKDGPFCIAKGTCDVPEGISLDEIRTQFRSDFRNNDVIDRLFKKIDPMMIHMTSVTELEHTELLDADSYEQLRILWGALYLAPLISDRDFSMVQHVSQTKCPVTGETIFVSSSFSVPLEGIPDMESTVGRVRAELRLTGYIFRPHPTLEGRRISMSFLGQADPKGYLPTSVVNLASVSQALNAGRVRDIYVQYNTFKKALGDEVPFPFDSYVVQRRGGKSYHPTTLHPPEPNANTFFVRLRAHADYNITVQIEETDEPFTLSVADNKKEDQGLGSDLVAGKAVTFGGKNLLDVVLQVTLSGDDNNAPPPVLNLEFTNPNWKKTAVCVPVTMPTFMSDPTAASTSASPDASPADVTDTATEQ